MWCEVCGCGRGIAAGRGVTDSGRECAAGVAEPLALPAGPFGYLEDPETQVCPTVHLNYNEHHSGCQDTQFGFNGIDMAL